MVDVNDDQQSSKRHRVSLTVVKKKIVWPKRIQFQKFIALTLDEQLQVLDHGMFDPNTTYQEIPVLHYMISQKADVRVIEALVLHGADLDWVNAEGKTAIDCVLSTWHVPHIKFVLDQDIAQDMRCRIFQEWIDQLYECNKAEQDEILYDTFLHGAYSCHKHHLSCRIADPFLNSQIPFEGRVRQKGFQNQVEQTHLRLIEMLIDVLSIPPLNEIILEYSLCPA